jgi:class 3 adenylate cyclase
VRALCRRELARCPQPSPYWLHATLAEAVLLLGERSEAEEQYGLAAERAGARYADLSTTRRQARWVLAKRAEDPGWVDDILRVPPLLLFTGHMIDRPERETARFPPELEGPAAGSIRQRIRRLRPAAGYASAACGADILFLESMLAERREFHVVLPVSPEEFLPSSVEFLPGGDWRRRFERVLATASSVTAASDHASSDSASTFVYANLILSGMAALHARLLETELVGLAVWDGQRGDGPGGTASLVQHWQSRGLAVERIDPAAVAAHEEVGAAPRATVETPAPDAADALDELPDQLMAMLFADAVGYSKLREEQIPLFVEHFLAPIAELIERSPRPPILKETAGDGLYLVFQRVRDAGVFALALRDWVSGVDWEACGLPPSMSLRVALHCGPVQKLVDPISGQPKYTGPHTSRAARIEPITPPGQVYASQAFAAVAAATGVEDLVFEYVGRTALAKSYGSLPLYHVRRA